LLKTFYNLINKNKLAKNSLLYFIGQSGERIVYTIAIPILVVTLSPHEYGLYGLIYSIINFAPLILSLGFSVSIPRLYFDNKVNVISSVGKFILLISIIIALISIAILFMNSNYGNLVTIAGLIIAVNMLSSVFTGVLIAKEMAFKNSVTSALSGTIFLFLLLCINHFSKLNITTLLLIILMGRLFFLFAVSYRNLSIFCGSLDLSIIKSNLYFSVPYMIHAGSIWFLFLGNRWILSFFSEMEKVGIFTLYTQIASTVIWLIEPMNSSFSPRLNNHFINKGIPGIISFHKKSFSLYFYTGIIGSFAVALGGIFYLIKFALPIYQEYLVLMPILLIGYFFQILYFPLTNIRQALKDTKTVAKLTIIASFFSLISNIILIYLLDIYGAAISSMLTYILLFILYKNNLKILPLNYSLIKIKNMWDYFKINYNNPQ